MSEYGAPLDAESRARLFPFLPATMTAGSPFTKNAWADIPGGDESRASPEQSKSQQVAGVDCPRV